MSYRFSMCDLLNSVYPNVLKLEFAVFSQSYKKKPCDKVLSEFCLCVFGGCVERGSCSEDEHDWQRCLCPVYPESSALQHLFQPQAKRRRRDRRFKEGLFPPLDRECKLYFSCVCVVSCICIHILFINAVWRAFFVSATSLRNAKLFSVCNPNVPWMHLEIFWGLYLL